MKESENNHDPISDSIEILQRRLKNFALVSTFSDDWDSWEKVNISRFFPHPEYLQITLALSSYALKLNALDKMRWASGFTYKGALCAIALQRTGLFLYLSPWEPEAHSSDLNYSSLDELTNMKSLRVESIISELEVAVKLVERKFIEKLFDNISSEDYLYLRNDYQPIKEMYAYFRKEALNLSETKTDVHNDAAIATKKNSDSGDWSVSEIFAPWFEQRARFRKKGYYEFAAVLAFFSLLEHTLVLLMPFSAIAFECSLNDFIKKDFRTKWNLIFPKSETGNEEMREAIFHASDKFRNFFAHGGITKGGRSVHITLAGVGTVANPAFKNSKDPSLPFIEFLPNEPTIDTEVFPLFDKLELWLTTSSAKFGLKFIEEGLDVPHNMKFSSDFMERSSDEAGFDDWLSLRSEMTDRAINFEL